MISPKEAAAKRSVRESVTYTKHVAEIDALLCRFPNGVDSCWAYDFPVYRDNGSLRHAIIEDYKAAGWIVTTNTGKLFFREPQP